LEGLVFKHDLKPFPKQIQGGDDGLREICLVLNQKMAFKSSLNGTEINNKTGLL